MLQSGFKQTKWVSALSSTVRESYHFHRMILKAGPVGNGSMRSRISVCRYRWFTDPVVVLHMKRLMLVKYTRHFRYFTVSVKAKIFFKKKLALRLNLRILQENDSVDDSSLLGCYTVRSCKFISLFNQLDAQNFFHNKFYFTPLHVSSTFAYHQEVKIALMKLIIK